MYLLLINVLLNVGNYVQNAMSDKSSPSITLTNKKLFEHIFHYILKNFTHYCVSFTTNILYFCELLKPFWFIRINLAFQMSPLSEVLAIWHRLIGTTY